MKIYGLILAGGVGTRLWPVSTLARPKQFVAFQGETTLLQQTFDYLLPLIPASRIYVTTFTDYQALVYEQLPELPEGHVLVEPFGCGTAEAVGIVAAMLQAVDPSAVFVCTAADLFFANPELYRLALDFGAEIADHGQPVLLGISPTGPETGYGYIRLGKLIAQGPGGLQAFRAPEYVSKPTRTAAEKYVQEHTHVWYSGVCLWRAERIQHDINRYQPLIGEGIARIAECSNQMGWESALKHYSGAQGSVTIETGVIQQAGDVVVIPLDTSWSDLGTWERMATQFPEDASHNRVHIHPAGQYVAIEAHNTLVYSTTGHTIVTIGVDDLIIVQTDDSLLICRKNGANCLGEVQKRIQQ